MSVEQVHELLRRAATDHEFRERVESAEQANRSDVLRSEGYGDVEKEHLDQAVEELSDRETSGVSGGGNIFSETGDAIEWASRHLYE